MSFSIPMSEKLPSDSDGDLDKPLFDIDDDQERMIEIYNAPAQMESLYYQSRGSESLKSYLSIRIPYYIPIIGWLPRYNWRTDLKNDIVAGLGVAAMLIPQGLAYALLVGVPPHLGLYSAFFPLLIYFLLGTSKQLSIGPDALSSLLCGLFLMEQQESPEYLVSVLTFMVGAVLLLLGLLRVGFFDNVLSRPLLVGFVNAVATTIILYQLDSLFGLTHPNNHSWQKLLALFQDFNRVNWPTFLIGVISMAILVANRVLKTRFSVFRYVPETLVVVILGILFNYWLDLQQYGVSILGEMQQGFELPSAPPLRALGRENGYFVLSSVIVSIVGFIEHIIVAKLYASKHNYHISPNRELVALGFANLFGSFFHTFPTFGSLPRSAVADNFGARSQIFGLIAGIIIAITIFVLGPVFALLPRVIMSAIIIVASIGLYEFHDAAFLLRAYRDLALLVATFLLTIGLGPEIGVGISLAISVFLIVKQSTYPFITVLGQVPGTESFKEASSGDTVPIPGITIVRIEEPLYFANIAQIKRLFARIEKLGDPMAHPGQQKTTESDINAIIIHARNIITIDASALQTIAEMVEDYEKRNIRVCFVKLRDQVRKQFEAAGIIQTANVDERIFASTIDAVKFVQSEIEVESEKRRRLGERREKVEDGVIEDGVQCNGDVP